MLKQMNRDHHHLIWAEINKDAIRHNLSQIKKLVDPNTGIMAVIKAQAYGHGLIEIANLLKNQGVNYFAVARYYEALELRQSGIKTPILILGHTPCKLVDSLIEHDITQTVHSLEMAQVLDSSITIPDHKLKMHIKIDCGMGRLGVGLVKSKYSLSHTSTLMEKNEILKEVESIIKLRNLIPEGIYTHFPAPDDIEKTKQQLDMFLQFLDDLKEKKISFEITHAANSASIIKFPETHLNMIRPGIILYGLYPSPKTTQEQIHLKPAMELKARISYIKKVPKNFELSYDSTYKTQEATTIATISVGYGDGLPRALSSRGRMLVNGESAPITGRVCMDQTMIDIGKINPPEVGDEVVIIGSQGPGLISAEEIAEIAGTINYEVVTSITSRVPRFYNEEQDINLEY